MNLLPIFQSNKIRYVRVKILIAVIVVSELVINVVPCKVTRLTGIWQHPSISLLAPRETILKYIFTKNSNRIYKEFAKSKHVDAPDLLLLNWINSIHCNDYCINHWCPELLKARLSPHCRNKELLIIDAGAHIGDTSLWVAKFAKITHQRVKVIAIDPDPGKIAFINKMIRLNQLQDYIITINCAVGDINTTGNLNIVTNDHNQIDVHSAANWIEANENGNVKIRRIDEIIESLGLKDYSVGFIHLDLEGYEYNALKGAEKIISTFKPIVVTEVFYEREQRSIRDDIHELMKRLGFTRSEKIYYHWGDTIFYNRKNTEQVDLLKQVFML